VGDELLVSLANPPCQDHLDSTMQAKTEAIFPETIHSLLWRVEVTTRQTNRRRLRDDIVDTTAFKPDGSSHR